MNVKLRKATYRVGGDGVCLNISKKVRDNVSSQVYNQVYNQIDNTVWTQVWDRCAEQIYLQLKEKYK